MKERTRERRTKRKKETRRKKMREGKRESTPAPDLRINGERLKMLDINDACRNPGYWGTGNGDMSATREVVREKARVARDLIKSHPLTPEPSAELFAQRRNRRLPVLGSPNRMVAE